MLLIAHPAHWITGVAYFLPVLAFLAWLAFAQLRDRLAQTPSPDGDPPGGGVTLGSTVGGPARPP